MYKEKERKFYFCEHPETYYKWYTRNGKKCCYCTECEEVVYKQK